MAKKAHNVTGMLGEPVSNAEAAPRKLPAVTCQISVEDQVRLKVHCATTQQKQKDVLALAIKQYLDRDGK